MRWKFLVIVSIVASIVASLLWTTAMFLFFGPEPVFDFERLWRLSFAVPLAVSLGTGFFVYRHTSKRRKLQAMVATLMVLVLTALAYFGAAQLWPKYLNKPVKVVVSLPKPALLEVPIRSLSEPA
jgi:ABC-type uncharacterized transport system permease subunit